MVSRIRYVPAVGSETTEERRRDKRAMLGAIGLLTLVSAAAIAVAIIVSVHNGRDAPRNGPHGIHLTADEATGRELFARVCGNCHTLAAVNAVGRIGPNLDVLIGGIPKTARYAVVAGAIESGFAGPGGQMPAGIYQGQEAADVAHFVAAVAGK
jgi:mono/diheme cytochrome c family protein